MLKIKMNHAKPLISILIVAMLLGIPLSLSMALKPEQTSAQTDSVESLLTRRQWSQAVEALKAKTAQNPSDLARQSRLVSLYLLLGKTSDAIAVYKQFAQTHPFQLAPLMLHGEILAGPLVARDPTSKEEQALPSLKAVASQAKSISTTKPITHYLAGLVNKFEAQNEPAEADFLEALNQEPNNILYMQELADLYLTEHQIRLAAPLLKQAYEIDATNADTLYLLGRIFQEKGDPEKALEYLNQSENFDPKAHAQRLLITAEVQQELGNQQEAAKILHQLLTYTPQRGDLWSLYAQTMESLGDNAEAQQDYKRAFQLEPALINTYMTRAEHVFWTKPISDSITRYRQVLQMNPQSQSAMITLAHLYYYGAQQEGTYPLQTDLDELTGLIQDQEKNQLEPILQIAEIQLEVLRLRHWTTGLRNVLSEILQTEQSANIFGTIAILQNNPVAAQTAVAKLSVSPDSCQELQWFALIGAWPWSESLAGKNAHCNSLFPYTRTWRDKQLKIARYYLSQAKFQLGLKQPESAIKALEKAQIAHPLSFEIQLGYASAYLEENKLDKAKESLQNAIALGIPPGAQADADAIQQQIDDATNGTSKKKKKRKKN
jgi:tetratricopeptide (TPR) repeat protein